MLLDDNSMSCNDALGTDRCPASTSATPSDDISAASTSSAAECRSVLPPYSAAVPLESSLNSTRNRCRITWRPCGTEVISASRLIRRWDTSFAKEFNHCTSDNDTHILHSSDLFVARTRFRAFASGSTMMRRHLSLRKTSMMTRGFSPMTTIALLVLLLVGRVAALAGVTDANEDPILQLCGRALTGEVRRICGTTRCRKNDDLSTKALPQVRSHHGFFKCCTNRCRRSHIEAFCCGGNASMVATDGGGDVASRVASETRLYRTYNSLVSSTEPEPPHIVLIDEASDSATPIRFDVDEAMVDETMRRHRRRQPSGRHRHHHHYHHHQAHHDDANDKHHRHYHHHNDDDQVAGTSRIDRALRRYELAVDGRPVSGTLAERIQLFRNRARAFDSEW